jgi:hypothetical protein
MFGMPILNQGEESLDYPHQKPEALLERIIKASSNEGDLVADFFCGAAQLRRCEKLGLKWITTIWAVFGNSRRLIGVQRELQGIGKISGF